MYDVLAQYPDNVDIVEEEINTCEEKINNCVDNPEVINRYNAGLARITELEQRLEILNDSNEEEARKVAAVRNPFVTRLEHTINELNKRFSAYMEQMGCGGEVELLNKGDTYGDYGKWGIAIKVRFRNRTDEDMLKILDKEIHSGGERSVSTILYLMAMQDLQSSPFRVVDEVNQGMDAHNERLVFSRIVRNSCRTDCKQFFLITPKLLQGLIAMDNPFVTVHFILNGPHALNGQHPFSMRDLVQLMRSKRAAAGGGGGGD
ncbi:P-loop containing nucleoside triphosphate hydrolase protein, partial [Tribonema minus]